MPSIHNNQYMMMIIMIKQGKRTKITNKNAFQSKNAPSSRMSSKNYVKIFL